MAKRYIPSSNIDTNFQTPLNVCRYMVSLIPEGSKTILEPTPGIGNIANMLYDKGYDVTCPDDYFLLNKNSRYDCIVGNPPFSSKYAFLDNADKDYSKYGMRLGYMMLSEWMQMSDNLIVLLPWFTISDSDVRTKSLVKYGLVSLTSLPRSTFQYARIQTVVMHLQKGYKGDILFKVFSLIKDGSIDMWHDS